jgi:hypothetical protein
MNTIGDLVHKYSDTGESFIMYLFIYIFIFIIETIDCTRSLPYYMLVSEIIQVFIIIIIIITIIIIILLKIFIFNLLKFYFIVGRLMHSLYIL